jgi:hypothetical protein
MRRILRGTILALALADSVAGCAPKHSMPESPPIEMHSLGGPTIIGDAAYGVTTSGGGSCRKADGTIDAAGCGTMYRFEPSGQFAVIRSFPNDAKAPFGMPATTSGSTWFYGTTGQSSSGTEAGPALYRISRDGSTFEVLQHAIAGYSEVSVSTNAAYVFRNNPDQSTTLERLVPSGEIEDLATFPGMFGLTAPLVRGDGSIALILNDFSCGVEIGTLEGHGFRKLFERETGNASGKRCFRSGEPAWGIATSDGGLISSNPHEIVRVAPNGSLTISTRLPPALGDFVGNLVVRRGEVFALSASESGKDPICTRLLRIRGEKTIDVVHAFLRTQKRCITDRDYVLPRLAVDGSNFVIATSASNGSIVWLRANGAESASHDFIQAANITDGAEPNLTTALDGVGRTLRLTFFRAGPATAPPFTLDPDGLSLVMKNPSGGSHRLMPSESGTLASHVTPAEFTGWQRAKGEQIITLDFPIPLDVPEGVYFTRFATDPIVRNSQGETLGVSRTVGDIVTTTTNAEFDVLRKRYLGKNVFFTINGDEGICAASKAAPSINTTTPLMVSSIKRMVGSVARIPTSGDDALSFDPFLFTLKSAPGTRSQYGRPCPTISLMQPGTWEFERSFSLRPTMDQRWPRRVRVAFTPTVGMTRAMVVAIWGYPRGLETVAELDHESQWHYDVFDNIEFQGDRVSAVLMKNQP